jgi:hypothetical protein
MSSGVTAAVAEAPAAWICCSFRVIGRAKPPFRQASRGACRSQLDVIMLACTNTTYNGEM